MKKRRGNHVDWLPQRFFAFIFVFKGIARLKKIC